jgi:hypothetical protein
MQHFLAPPLAHENMDDFRIFFVLWLPGDALPDLTDFAMPIAISARFDLGDIAHRDRAGSGSRDSDTTATGEYNA